MYGNVSIVSTETTDTDITTTEIIKRRDVGPYGIRSEYCIRKIICPLGNRDTPKGNGCFHKPYTRLSEERINGFVSSCE